MAIYELDGQAPELPSDGNYFIADTAAVIGKIRLLDSASVWFGAVLRGDNNDRDLKAPMRRTTAPVTPKASLTIGKGCTIGHNAVLYRRTIEDGALVGMG